MKHLKRAAILAIGDELTSGYRLDTNSQAIARRLAAIPLHVTMHLAVEDELESIRRGLHVALDAADVVVATGGLGPTADDLTRQAVAATFERELVEDEQALEHMRRRFERRELPMPESNRIQACVPAGSHILYNERGTAPGFYLQHEGQHLFVVPGIPYEMEGLLEKDILPRLRELVGDGHVVRRAELKVYGLPESEINERLRSIMGRDRNPLLGLLPHRGTITVELVAGAESAAQAEALLEADREILRERLGHHVISEDERDLPHVVADLLLARGLTIATFELGTGGLVAARLTQPEGSERWFRRSVVSDVKLTLLGLTQGAGLADEETAGAMSTVARQATQADVGVGVGDLVLSEDDTPGRPYGVIPVAVNVQGQETTRVLRFNGDRETVREWAADAVLALIYRNFEANPRAKTASTPENTHRPEQGKRSGG
jgi:nicotinamide-nucleotide amidase